MTLNSSEFLPSRACGVRIAGTGMYVPPRTITNADLEAMMDTSDVWILQRTGIAVRHIAEPEQTLRDLAVEAGRKALADAGVTSADLDLLILATVGAETTCPSTACRVLDELGGGSGGAFDLVAACSGFVYSLNVAHNMIRCGSARRALVIGAEHLTQYVEYTTRGRGTAILFGDAAAGAVLEADEDPSRGIIAQAMHSDGSGWKDLFLPHCDADFPPEVTEREMLGRLHMNGRAVFKFAVKTFCDLIDDTLLRGGVLASDVDLYICHQSNVRILEAARERFGIPSEKLYVNIDRFGNTSSASVPLCLDELRRAGRVKPGMKVMFVAFGGGLTWASSLWQM
ncbi:MAG: ketoacyl-ACP synthase III [Phycisphaeraceae bacterium]|nr:ketoacyl-ACP synthase III [Phycisphaeraceae bacterium]MCW5763977.1 ketoacyl-ACP synthase III [Phycisphaeraceae bacterium]